MVRRAGTQRWVRHKLLLTKYAALLEVTYYTLKSLFYRFLHIKVIMVCLLWKQKVHQSSSPRRGVQGRLNNADNIWARFCTLKWESTKRETVLTIEGRTCTKNGPKEPKIQDHGKRGEGETVLHWEVDSILNYIV